MAKMASIRKYSCGCRIIHYIEHGEQWYSLHGCEGSKRGHEVADNMNQFFDEHLHADTIVCVRHYRQRKDGSWTCIGVDEYKK